MIRKISFLIISVAILITGIIAFQKLNYWERSVRIFRYNSNASPQGSMERGHGGFERNEIFRESGRFERTEMNQLPDSIRTRFAMRGNHPEITGRNFPDSLKLQSRQNSDEQIERTQFRGGMRNIEGRGRGEFPGGRKTNLRNVQWFLAVFASITAIVIYIDNGFSHLYKKRKAIKKYDNFLEAGSCEA